MDRQPAPASFPHEPGTGSIATVRVEHGDRVVVARVHGEIDTSNVADVERTIESVIPGGALGLVVDLTEVDYFNSATIKMLFDVSERLRERGQQLRVAIADEAPMRAILSLVNFEQLVPLHRTAEDAEARIASDATAPRD